MFAAIKRATLLYPSPSARDPSGKHLFILLTDPSGPANLVLMVGVATVQGSIFDSTCILKAGDHTFIKHPSYVAYALCRVEPADKLIKGVENKFFVDKGLLDEPCSSGCLMG